MTDKKRRVFVVDDEPNNLKLMNQILQDHYQMAFASSGIKVLEVVEKVQPSLILLDIMMPEMDGYEVCRKLKKNKRTSDIPIIFITAKSQTEDETKGLGFGAVDYRAYA